MGKPTRFKNVHIIGQESDWTIIQTFCWIVSLLHTGTVVLPCQFDGGLALPPQKQGKFCGSHLLEVFPSSIRHGLQACIQSTVLVDNKTEVFDVCWRWPLLVLYRFLSYFCRFECAVNQKEVFNTVLGYRRPLSSLMVDTFHLTDLYLGTVIRKPSIWVDEPLTRIGDYGCCIGSDFQLNFMIL